MHSEENGDVAVLVLFGLIHLVIGPGRFHGGFGGGSKNPASEALLLPLTLASFIGSLAEAAKS